MTESLAHVEENLFVSMPFTVAARYMAFYWVQRMCATIIGPLSVCVSIDATKFFSASKIAVAGVEINSIY